MLNQWLHRFALLNSACALLLLALGAILSGNVSGGLFGFAQLTRANFFPGIRNLHADLGMAVGALIVAFTVGTLLVEKRSEVRIVSLVALVLVLVGITTGLPPAPLATLPGFLHAFAAQAMFAATVALAALTAAAPASQEKPPEMLQDKGWPSLRGLATTTLTLIVLQIILGAAFRHGAMGVLWHIVGALVVAAFAMGLTMLIFNFPEHGPLRRAAVLFVILIALQLTLGMTIISMGPRTGAQAVMTVAVMHTVIGSAILATGIVLWLRIRRYVAWGGPAEAAAGQQVS